MSTVGLVPGMDKLTAEGIPVTLALSLHAPDDELRKRARADQHPVVGRRGDRCGPPLLSWPLAAGSSIEYALIRDINDQGWRADLLGEKLNGRGQGWVHVNPIPLNPHPGLEVGPPRGRGSSRTLSSGCGPTASRRPSATPGARTSTAPAASSPPPPPEPAGPPHSPHPRHPLHLATDLPSRPALTAMPRS